MAMISLEVASGRKSGLSTEAKSSTGEIKTPVSKSNISTDQISTEGISVLGTNPLPYDDLPIQPTREIPSWNGSGPSTGILGVSPSSTSTAALQNFTNSDGVEFIFNPSTSTFLVRGHKSNGKHEVLAETINAPKDQVLGGILTRSDDGSFITNESSGHY